MLRGERKIEGSKIVELKGKKTLSGNANVNTPRAQEEAEEAGGHTACKKQMVLEAQAGVHGF